MNLVILVGNLGKKPKLTQTENSNVCTFSIATTRRYRNKKDEDVEETEWHDVVCWGGLAKTVAKYCDKGRQVTIRGRLKTDKYFDEENSVDRYRTKIVAEQIVFGAGGDRNAT